MAFKLALLTEDMIQALKPLRPRIKRHDRSLEDQMVRAANSVGMNVAEAQFSDPGNRRARFYTAAGSANETRAALRLAVAWGYFPASEAKAALGLLDQIVAILWKLTH